MTVRLFKLELAFSEENWQRLVEIKNSVGAKNEGQLIHELVKLGFLLANAGHDALAGSAQSAVSTFNLPDGRILEIRVSIKSSPMDQSDDKTPKA